MEKSMNVKLISHSEPAGEMPADIDDMQQLVAFCARVSNPSNQTNTETSEKLIRYLINHKHWSPLEMVSAILQKICRSFFVSHDYKIQKTGRTQLK